jgi:hypothetical protein
MRIIVPTTSATIDCMGREYSRVQPDREVT